MIKIALAMLVCVLCKAAFAESISVSRVIRANAIIAPSDLIILQSTYPGALAASDEIVGLEARVTLYPGRPIMPSQVGPAALVTRNQLVSLRYRKGNLVIEADARALGRGGVGETIRVMNLASKTTVSGLILANGTLEVRSE